MQLIVPEAFKKCRRRFSEAIESVWNKVLVRVVLIVGATMQNGGFERSPKVKLPSKSKVSLW